MEKPDSGIIYITYLCYPCSFSKTPFEKRMNESVIVRCYYNGFIKLGNIFFNLFMMTHG